MVFAGDIFDLFVGNKQIFLKHYSAFIQSLLSVARKGVIIHYIEGNHDFLLEKAFHSISGLNLHSQDVSVCLFENRFYIAHGDSVDPLDYGYRLLRVLFRSFLMRIFIYLIPCAWLEAVGRFLSNRSKKKWIKTKTKVKPSEIYRNFALKKFNQGYDHVVLGHTHVADEVQMVLGARKVQYMNMGFPREDGSFLIWNSMELQLRRMSFMNR